MSSQLSDDERDPLSHQTADEVDVAAEPIELRDDDWAFQTAGHLESRGKLRPALKASAPLPVSTSVKVLRHRSARLGEPSKSMR